MPRKKQSEISEAPPAILRETSKRKLKPVINLDYVYESPNPKKTKKIDEIVKEKEAPAKKPAILKSSSVSSIATSASDVDAQYLEPFKYGWIREVVSTEFDIRTQFLYQNFNFHNLFIDLSSK